MFFSQTRRFTKTLLPSAPAMAPSVKCQSSLWPTSQEVFLALLCRNDTLDRSRPDSAAALGICSAADTRLQLRREGSNRSCNHTLSATAKSFPSLTKGNRLPTSGQTSPSLPGCRSPTPAIPTGAAGEPGQRPPPFRPSSHRT